MAEGHQEESRKAESTIKQYITQVNNLIIQCFTSTSILFTLNLSLNNKYDQRQMQMQI